MDIEALVSKYFGWCPGIKSASKFIPSTNLSIKRKGFRAHHVCLAMLIIIITFNAVFISQTQNFIDRALVTSIDQAVLRARATGGPFYEIQLYDYVFSIIVI